MSILKQGTLSFASAKRTKSALRTKSQQRIPVTEQRESNPEETPVEGQDDAKLIETLEISDGEGAAAPETTVPIKRTRVSANAKSKKQKPSPEGTDKERLDVEDRAGRYRKYYHEVRSKMGHMEPVHSEGQNRIHQMLRLFDMSYEFGPCIGMTRLERWERAEVFGLNPPVEVRDILLTKEGIEKTEYSECVLHGEV